MGSDASGVAGADKYRYGFNGKEKDDEVKGTGNEIDYGMRVYDPRIGRFMSVDPLTKEYPYFAPFQFAGNSPLTGIDLDGEEYLNFNKSLIDLSVQYDSKLKTVTTINVFFNMENVSPPTREAIKSRKVSQCENCFAAVGGSPLIGRLAYKSPLIKTASEAAMDDVPTPKSLTQEAIYIRNVPQDKNQEREIEKSGKFWSPSNIPAQQGGAKADALIGIINLETYLL